MWLFLATAAWVPPTVSLGYFLSQRLYAHHLLTFQVLLILNLNGKLHSFVYVNEEWQIELNSAVDPVNMVHS